MAVVNAREWMGEPLLKASIDPLPDLKESKGLDVAEDFRARHKGADAQVPPNKGIFPVAKPSHSDSKYVGITFTFSKV